MRISTELLESFHYIGHLSDKCPYLEARESRLRFLLGADVGRYYRELLDRGYRRHGVHFYRPECEPCQECQILRMPVGDFKRTRSQKRAWKKGQQVFTYSLEKPRYTPEKARLYREYLIFQHQKEEFPEGSEEAHYTDFFVESVPGVDTRELQLFHEGRLVGLGIVDFIGDVLSSVYFYFSPDVAHLSPGVYSMLLELEIAKERGLAFYYPGYFIQGCKTMDYKLRFQPAELKRTDEQVWRPVDSPTTDAE